MFVGRYVELCDTTAIPVRQVPCFIALWYDGGMEAIHYTVKIHPAAEGGYWAEVPALSGCFSQGNSLEEVTARVREAMECHLTSLLRDGLPFPVEKRAKKGFAIPVTVHAPRMA
jgi:predicted RNase H-like HicB family nuclease